MKKALLITATGILPFLLVWAAFILTAFNFNPREIFNSGNFWGFSVIYWFVWLCMLGLIVELVDDSVTTKEDKFKKVSCPNCRTEILSS